MRDDIYPRTFCFVLFWISTAFNHSDGLPFLDIKVSRNID